jgi:hypothetical protein
MQMQDSCLAGNQAGNMSITREPQKLVQCRLTRAMITHRDLSDTNHRVDVNDIVANPSGQRYRRYVVATSVTPGVKALLTQRERLCHQRSGVSSGIVGAEYPHGAGYTCDRKLTQRHRWHAALESGLTTAAGKMGMTID